MQGNQDKNSREVYRRLGNLSFLKPLCDLHESKKSKKIWQKCTKKKAPKPFKTDSMRAIIPKNQKVKNAGYLRQNRKLSGVCPVFIINSTADKRQRKQIEAEESYE